MSPPTPPQHPPPQPLACCWTSLAPEATRQAARALAGLLGEATERDAFVVALCGGLGAGKTLFAQGLAEGLGVAAAEVASPTYTIVSEYSLSSGGRLAHIDLYRLASAAELEATGFVDLLEAGSVLAIEWADRFPEALPRDRLEVTLTRDGLACDVEFGDATAPATRRRISGSATGAVSSEVLARWRRELVALGLAVEGQERGG